MKELIIKVESLISSRKAVANGFIKKISDALKGEDKKLPIKEEDKLKLSFDEKCKKYNISDREKEALFYALQGLAYKEIGINLKISEKTVITHIGNIRNKVGTDNLLSLYKIFME